MRRRATLAGVPGGRRLGQTLLEHALQPRVLDVDRDGLVQAHVELAAVDDQRGDLVVEPGAVALEPPADARVAHAGEPRQRARDQLEAARPSEPDLVSLLLLERVAVRG